MKNYSLSRPHRLAAFALLAVSSIATHSAHAALLVQSANRDVLANDGHNPAQNVNSNATSGAFNPPTQVSVFSQLNVGEDRAEANQNSNIGPFLLSGTGNAFVNGEVAKLPEAHSFFDVDFTLASSFDFAGFITLHKNADGGTLLSRATLAGTNFNVFDFALDEHSANSMINIPISGTLAAGDYSLSTHAVARGNGGFSFDQADFDIALTFSPVTTQTPAPSTSVLIAVGIGAALLLRKRASV